MDTFDLFKKYIKENEIVKEYDSILLCVSGGADSMFMSNLFVTIKSEFGLKLYIAHLNHGIRGEEADKDEEFVKKFAIENNIAFFSKKVNMREYGKMMKISEEDAGRRLRYEYFNQIADTEGIERIATAHNMNDRAETLLLNILRGSGIKGLESIEPKRGNIIRPILCFKRKEIEAFMHNNGYEFRTDKSNLESDYKRNFIRNEIIPKIEEKFKSDLTLSLNRLSKIASLNNKFVEDIISSDFKKSVKDDKINIEIFNKFNFYEKTLILRKYIEKICGNLKDISYVNIEDIINLISAENSSGKKIDILKKYYFVIDFNSAYLIKKESFNKIESFVDFEIDKVYNIGDLKFRFVLSEKPVDGALFVDYDKIKGKLIMRNKKENDKFMPYGRNGHKKLKKYFIEKQISSSKRERVIILSDEENIVMIPPYDVSDIYKIDSSTKRFLNFVMEERYGK